MITYQDLLLVGEGDIERAAFVKSSITRYKRSEAFEIAQVADDYDRNQNTTITNYQRKITLLSGEQVDDRFSATHRSASNFFNIATTQINQYLLGNGCGLEEASYEKLGKNFDQKLQQIGHSALCSGVAYGMYDLNHVEMFSALEFVPLLDEDNGALAAGIRFWQLDSSKPLRAKLYERDGYTSYLWTSRKDQLAPDGWTRLDKGVYMQPKRPYVIRTVTTEAEGTQIYDGEPYPDFPIIPMYANPHKQSEIVGLREKIDAYDFILNGFEDDLDNAQIYWIISGAGGMDDPDLKQFLERLKTVKAAAPGDGQNVAPVQVEIPYAAREALLNRLNRQIYADAMLMNPEDIAGGAVTATQIRAAYERQNVKTDQFEYCVLDFCDKLFAVAGVDDEPTFTRSTIFNAQEEVATVVSAAQYLPRDYVTEKIMTLFGDKDKVKDALKQMAADEEERMAFMLEQANA